MHGFASNVFSLVTVMALGAAAGCGASAPPSAPATPAVETPEPVAKVETSTKLHGTLMGHDGTPMPLAHVSFDGEPLEVAADGSFEWKHASPALVRAKFTGVDHGDYMATLFLSEESVTMNVTLGTYEAPSELEDLSVVEIRFMDKGQVALGSVTPMTKAANGTFAAEVKAKVGQFAYEIRGTTSNTGLSMNSTERTEFRYDGDGNYCNVVQAEGGVVHVAFDPAKSLKSGVATVVRFANPQSKVARIADVFDARKMPSTGDVALSSIGAEIDPEVHSARAIALFSALNTSIQPSPSLVELARMTLADLPPQSVLWKASPGSIVSMAIVAGPEFTGQVDDLIAHFVSQENIGAASKIAFGMLMHASEVQDDEALAHYYALFGKELAGTRVAQFAKMFNPEREIRIGNDLPEFSLVNVDTRADLTKKSFSGKVFLMDFWATWCHPCMEELPNLHATYKKYNQQGFEILSINIDDKPGNGQAMRKKGKFPMPWNNVVLDANQGDAAKRTFEVYGLPTMILVGRDGRVIASEMSLRGPGLARTVEAALRAKAP